LLVDAAPLAQRLVALALNVLGIRGVLGVFGVVDGALHTD
jgi:hypothetical protein